MSTILLASENRSNYSGLLAAAGASPRHGVDARCAAAGASPRHGALRGRFFVGMPVCSVFRHSQSRRGGGGGELSP